MAARQFSTGTKFGGGGTPEAERFAFATGQEARAGKNSFPPTPFLFARPSVKVFQNSAFGFLRKKVRISFSVRSHIVCCEFIASALRAEAGRLYSICQDFLGSIATFCESKTRFELILLRKSRPATGFSCKAIIFSPKAIVQ